MVATLVESIVQLGDGTIKFDSLCTLSELRIYVQFTYTGWVESLCTQGELNDVLIGGGTLVLHIHIYKEIKVFVQGVYTMYNVYLQGLGEILFQQSETHLDHSF